MTPIKVCSKCGKKKMLRAFHKDKAKKDGHRPICKMCQQKYNENNAQAIAAQKKQWHLDVKKLWLEFIHADLMRCTVCGYNRCFAALEWHHNDPNEKDFNIARLLQRAFNKKNQQILLKELGKCICMCANCHAEFHDLQRKLQEEPV